MRGFSRLEQILFVWAAAIACALALALVAFWAINRVVYNPAGQVRQYIQALQEGNGARALGISGASVPANSGAALLDGDALKNSMKDLKDIKVQTTDISTDGKKATVDVSFQTNGQEKHSHFNLHQSGSYWGIFDQWSMDATELPVIHTSTQGARAATFNGVKVNVDGGKRDFAVFYPGAYQLDYQSALLVADQQSTVVTSADQDIKLAMSLKPSDAAQREINYQVKTYLDNCALINSLYPTGCPFEYAFSGRVQSDVSWSIKTYPQYSAKLSSDGSWKLSQGTGTAKVSFTQLNLLTGATSQVEKEIPFTLSPSVSVSGDNLTVTFPSEG